MNQLDPFNRYELGEMIETGLDKVLKTNQVVANINLYKDDTNKITIFPKRCTTLIPIQYQKLRLGTLLINGTRLTEEDLILVEYSSALINVELPPHQKNSSHSNRKQ